MNMPGLEQAHRRRDLTAEENRTIADLVATRTRATACRASSTRASWSIAPSSIASGGGAGCSSAIRARFRNPGDYFTFAVDDDSLIVIRDDDGEIHALWNVCRHRGTQICDEPQGKVGRLVCPYHQWTYARDGSLVSCRGMQEDVDKSELGLLRAHVREVAGLIFVSLADDPPDFDEAAEAIGPLARPAGLRSRQGGEDRRLRRGGQLEARLGKQPRMLPLQRQSSAVHQSQLRSLQRRRHERADPGADRQRGRPQREKWAAAGLAVSHRRSGMTQFPDAGPQLLVRREPHAAGRRLCERNDGRPAGRRR